MNKFLAPISFSTGPAIVKFHPKYANSLITIAHNGDVLIGDINDSLHTRSQIFSTNPSGYITSMCFCSTGDMMAIGNWISQGDSYGMIQTWSQREPARINSFSKQSLHESVVPKAPAIAFEDDM